MCAPRLFQLCVHHYGLGWCTQQLSLGRSARNRTTKTFSWACPCWTLACRARQLLPYSNEQQVSEPTNESQTRERELPWHFVISARSLRSPRKLRLDASARRQASRRLYQVYAIACDAASTLLELRSSVGRQVRLICSD